MVAVAAGRAEGAGREEGVGAEHVEAAAQEEGAERVAAAGRVEELVEHAEGAVWGVACRQGAVLEKVPRAMPAARLPWDLEEVARAPAQGESAGRRAAQALAPESAREARGLDRARVRGDRPVELAFVPARVREVRALGPALAWGDQPVGLAFAPARAREALACDPAQAWGGRPAGSGRYPARAPVARGRRARDMCPRPR